MTVQQTLSTMIADGRAERACGNKIRFRSHTRAMNFMGSVFMTLKDFTTFRPYRCEHCNRWHIGHYAKARQ
jgi:hypothetical protein